jgi:hypothetical protein
MATQTIQFRSPPSQTVTLRLFVAGSDTQISSAAATEATNRKGTYTAAFTDVPAAEYQYIATIGTSPIIPVASGYVLLTLTTATFQVYDFAKDRDGGGGGGGATAAEVWEELLTGSYPANSAGRILRDIKMADVLFEGQIVTATTQTATLDAGATSVCFGQAITIGEEGDVDRQTRFIVGFDPATKVITLDMPWCVIPPNGRDYSVKVLRNALAGDLDKSRAGSYGKGIADTKADTTTILASAGVNVLPAVGISASRAPGVFLSPFAGELISQSITVYASDGTTPIDLSGKTLEIVFEARGGGDVAVIANANITISGGDDNVVTFAYPSAVTAQERTLRFSLRDAGTPFTVYLTGLCKVSIAPSNDPA